MSSTTDAYFVLQLHRSRFEELRAEADVDRLARSLTGQPGHARSRRWTGLRHRTAGRTVR
ncbi:hypothetical protein [Micromonospora sonneratiae]|uniref:Uncharacterized protein n=1 Tax=Micromonospora sonneratiae TaxID=1184706 RepID=A0ABW3YNM3_9ACTN